MFCIKKEPGSWEAVRVNWHVTVLFCIMSKQRAEEVD